MSRLIKPFIQWVPRSDGRPGLEPSGLYDLWARVFSVDCRIRDFWRWRIVAPVRGLLGLPHYRHSPGGWS